MKKFLIHIFLFAIPILIFSGIIGIFYSVGYYSGEFADIDKSIEDQRNDHSILIGYGYNEQTKYYKLQDANYYQADIIALGTSRAMQFKGTYFFKESFYNCGGSVEGNYNEYRNFLQNLTYTPDILILDLDSWVFNDAWNKSCVEYNEFTQIQKVDRNVLAMIKEMAIDYQHGKWTWDSFSNYSNNIGFNGKINDNGFMYDGSAYSGKTYRYSKGQGDRFAETKDRISNGIHRFQYGEHIDSDTLVQLDNLLSYCTENDIYVIAYVAPFAPNIYKLMEDSGNYCYLAEIAPACKLEFEKYNFEFYDYTDGACLGVTDDFFLDGFHGSEVVYGYMVRDMTENDSRIVDYIDNDKLNLLIDNAYSGLAFENPDTRTIN